MDNTAAAPRQVYRSKRDAWLLVILWIVILGAAIAAIAVLVSPGALAGRLLTTVFLLAVGALVAWLTFGTYYTLTDHTLLIRAGPFRWRIPLGTITSVTPTHNPLSSPALSLDRLRISYPGWFGGIMIAPEPRAAFLDDLAARTPGLRRVGDRLVRN